MDVTDGTNPKWATWPNRTWLEGMNASATVAEPVPRRRSRQHGVRPGLARPDAARPQPALRHRRARSRRSTTRPRSRRSSGRTGTTSATSTASARTASRAVPWDNTGVQYGLGALTSGQAHAGRVPEAERDRRLVEAAAGHGAGGLPVHPGALREPGAVRPVEPAEHDALARRRRDAAPRASPATSTRSPRRTRRGSCSAGRSTSRRSTGGTTSRTSSTCTTRTSRSRRASGC